MYILEELKKVLRNLSGGWKINSQETVLTFGGIIEIKLKRLLKAEKLFKSKGLFCNTDGGEHVKSRQKVLNSI